MDIDNVVQRCSPGRFFPDFACQRIAHHNLAFMTEQIFQKLKFARGQFHGVAAASHFPSHDIHVEIEDLNAEAVELAATSTRNFEELGV